MRPLYIKLYSFTFFDFSIKMISVTCNKAWCRFIIFLVSRRLYLSSGKMSFVIILIIKDWRKYEGCTCFRREDYQLAQQVPEQEQGALYNDLKAAAESGWDFSYRWCIRSDNAANLSLINVSTSNIIPVDLNAIIQQNAKLLARFYRLLNNTEVSPLLNFLFESLQLLHVASASPNNLYMLYCCKIIITWSKCF